MKVAVAMSGGVDSSLAALMLKESGHEVTGITAEMFGEEVAPGDPEAGPCLSRRAAEDAAAVAELYGFTHRVIAVKEEFARKVIDPFCREYLAGRTPSPCIICNGIIKFRILLDAAMEAGCERLATGHYARIGRDGGGRYYVSRGADVNKDQSYFLFMLEQEALARTLFPLGGYRKEEIRALASRRGLPAAERPESQEICFVPGGDYPGFVEKRTGSVPPPGDIVDRSGRVIGRHRGIHRYTIGQRRGLGIAAERPLYVADIDATHNVIVAGYAEDLYRRGCISGNLSYMKIGSLDGIETLVKVRSTQPPAPARLEMKGERVAVHFNEPLAGISPGQASVFYSGEGDVLAGGWIESSF